jgi:hypothetical protein
MIRPRTWFCAFHQQHFEHVADILNVTSIDNLFAVVNSLAKLRLGWGRDQS